MPLAVDTVRGFSKTRCIAVRAPTCPILHRMLLSAGRVYLHQCIEYSCKQTPLAGMRGT